MCSKCLNEVNTMRSLDIRKTKILILSNWLKNVGSEVFIRIPTSRTPLAAHLTLTHTQIKDLSTRKEWFYQP